MCGETQLVEVRQLQMWSAHKAHKCSRPVHKGSVRAVVSFVSCISQFHFTVAVRINHFDRLSVHEIALRLHLSKNKSPQSSEGEAFRSRHKMPRKPLFRFLTASRKPLVILACIFHLADQISAKSCMHFREINNNACSEWYSNCPVNSIK